MEHDESVKQKSYDFSRRDLLKTVLYTAPAVLLGCNGAFEGEKIKPLYAPRIITPGQKIRAAQVGVFNRGGGVLGSFKQYRDTQIEFKAFADVAFVSHDSTMKDFPDVPCYRDYREMLEQMHDEIDAVIVCTPDFSHFPVVVHAMLLGKHVYVEKPMAQNVYECRLLEKVAKATGVVTQMGNQGHSGTGTFQFGDWVEAGLVKDVRKIDAWMTSSRRWHGWTYDAYPDEMPPVGYDWDQWLGRRPFRPHSSKLTGGNWRCWYEFGCGCMGDWGAHVLDAVHRYLKLGQPYEITTKVMGPSDLYYPQASVITFKFAAREDMPALELNWYDGQGNRPEPPAGYDKDMGNVGSFIYTRDYVIRGGSHGANYAIASQDKATQLAQSGKQPALRKNLSNHFKNFLNACQGIEPANSPFDISGPLAEMLALGCVGQRFGGTLKYDAKTMTITNHAEANKMLHGPVVRDGWDAYDQKKLVTSKKSRIKSPNQVTWTNLAEDKALSQWENPYDYGKAEVVDGEVHLTSDKGKWFLLTQKEYANFVFEGEIMMPVNEGNSGFLFRCQKGKNRAWGYQAEVDTADRKWSGGLYDEGRRMWFISPNRDKAASPAEGEASIAAFRARAGDCFKQGEWNKYRIVCIGSHIQIYVNGVLTTDVHDEMDISGYIGIQHHGEKGLRYKFRNLRIKDLGAGGEVYYPHREAAAQKASESKAVDSTLEGDVYEAEVAVLNGANAAKNHSGFQGTGFADYGDAGSYVLWDNVLGEKGGYVLTFRYASSGNRPCDLFVNNEKVGRLAFASTGSFTQWSTVQAKVTLKAGGNAVKVVSVGAGPNLDALGVTKQ